ncbi:hypothetical protein [Flavobacterium sp.]|jgi:hypothetical protein|uniref:hypothetical protein n=1 Tax=Flavobacterium sp. TaxID=239 RepID=UPI00261FE863|nr:hypothetical protein [Flavobacterium sp.]
MQWTSYPQSKPKESQPYLISVSKQHPNGEYIFNYVGYYDIETDKWHKYDAFSDDSIKEPITEKVLGWMSDMTSYLG